MPERVAVTETVRDAWQGLPHVLPTADKIAHVQRLLDAGFSSIDVGSFVSPRLVPAMADTHAVLAGLRRPPGARLIALVASPSGLERLLAAPGVDEVLYPFSLSESFQRRNTERTREQALADLGAIAVRAHGDGRTVYATISMAFGNNEGDPYDTGELADWMARLRSVGCDRIGLADTTAQASPQTVRQVLLAVAEGLPGGPPAVHLHATASSQEALVDAALEAGCRAFDAALGGLGGCQFAKGAESNLSTLPLARQLVARGYGTDLPLAVLEELDAAARVLARR